MSGTRSLWAAVAAAVAGLVAFAGAGELAMPARLLTVALVAVLPTLLLGQPGLDEDEAADLPVVPLYFSSMLVIWAIGAAAIWAGLVSGMSLEDLGIAAVDPVTGLAWTGGVTLLAVGALALGRALGRRETPLLERILPRTATERGLFVLLSLSAGVGEELAFRGFLIPALETASGSRVLAVVLSSLAFGMLHGYQGAVGALRAAALGAVLAVPFLATGSVYPSIAAHALYDLVVGLLLADWLLRRQGPGDPQAPREH